MLSSTGSDQTKYNTTTNNSSTTNNTLKRMLSSSTTNSSSSSWSSSSPSPFSPPQPSSSLQTSSRIMEEVWKDINLASLSETTPNHRSSSSSSSLLHINLPHGPHHHRPNLRNMTLQDFLGRPFAHNSYNDLPPHGLVSTATEPTSLNNPASPLPPPIAPPTLLSLNHSAGSQQFHLFYASEPLTRPPNSGFIDHNHSHNHNHQHHDQSNPTNISGSVSNSFSDISAYPFESSTASPPGLPSFGKRTLPESDHGSSRDRRHKRMIKNRESAARSRARKQAYTNELELEVAHLMEENARLKRQQQQLCFAAATQQPKRHNLHRSSTAPF